MHAWLAPGHFTHPALGAGFALAAVLQTVWALAAATRGLTPIVERSGAVLSAALVAAYVLQRTVGLPGTGAPEAVGVLDGLTVGAELALCGLLLGSERARQAGVVIGAALVCVLASGMGAH